MNVTLNHFVDIGNMTKIDYVGSEGTRSSVIILKTGEAMEIRQNDKTRWAPHEERTYWPCLAAWFATLPQLWTSVETWKENNVSLHITESGAHDITPQLAYFMDSTVATREDIAKALSSYTEYHGLRSGDKFLCDSYLVTLLHLNPKGSYTMKQLMTAMKAHIMPSTTPELKRHNAVCYRSDSVVAITLCVDHPLVPLCEAREAPRQDTDGGCTYYFRSDPRIKVSDTVVNMHPPVFMKEMHIPYCPEELVVALNKTSTPLAQTSQDAWTRYTIAVTAHIASSITAAAEAGQPRYIFTNFQPHDVAFIGGIAAVAAAIAADLHLRLTLLFPDDSVILEQPSKTNGGRLTLIVDWSLP